ncbi:uncharacterized protein V6R79_003492 [Siganus canaliculatus]
MRKFTRHSAVLCARGDGGNRLETMDTAGVANPQKVQKRLGLRRGESKKMTQRVKHPCQETAGDCSRSTGTDRWGADG